MNRWEKEVLASWLRDEKTALKAIEGHYTAALAEIKKKIILMEGQDGEMAQSQIYQLQYQKTLQAQISAILEKLHSDEYQTIQAFLEGCYTSGFLGTMYSVAGQGIPLLLPMDPAAVVRAVITDSKLSEDLYDALGVDINHLKRVIRSEISRGIAANLPIDEISRNISLRTGTPLAHAKTIARTESHRIQEAATEDARQAVKKRGCNVIKMWDSTLDGDTRPTHQQLDGQIRETDEPFEMNGKKAMFPGDFGDPAEDCNCRCHALTRAKAAMTERELEVLRGRAKYFGIDKSESFKDFQKKYQKAIDKNAKKWYNIEKKSALLIGAQFFANKGLLKQSNKRLQKSIVSWTDHIELHQRKVEHPEQYDVGWESKSEREKAGLIRHWEKEIRIAQKNIDEANELLKKRGADDE